MFTGVAQATPSANAIDTDSFFVRQQYLDFLGREPDRGGFAYWYNEITRCGADEGCRHSRRIGVSAAFFVEQEFQLTGSYLYDMYRGALGRQPGYNEYSVDRMQLVAGANLDAKKMAFATAFVERSDFVQRYQSSITAESFVQALMQNVRESSRVDLEARRLHFNTYYSGLNIAQSRALVVREVADDATLKQAEYNAAFVLAQYFSYLRRDPDRAGYDFWLDVLDHGSPNNYGGMVCAFITSAEYQRRFSSVVTHSNAECSTD